MSIKLPEVINLSIGGIHKMEVEVTPKNANQEVHWSSRNTKVATVDQNGKVTANSKGWALIIAIPKGNTALWDCCVVSVGTPDDDDAPRSFYIPHDPYDFGWRWVFDEQEKTPWISSGYNRERGEYPYHWGIDVAAGMEEEKILCPTFGIVVKTWKEGDNGYGNCVVIETNNIDPVTNKYIRILFAHMKDNPDFEEGDEVIPASKSIVINEDGEAEEVVLGTIIGLVGSTGWSSGPHLHLSMFNNGGNFEDENNAINPQKFFPLIKFTGDTELWCDCELHEND